MTHADPLAVAVVAALGPLDDIGRGLREAFTMFWDTIWALVLGFGISGAVQAFVSRESMQRALGDHGAGSTVRASLFGMASSSCSYAASAMARSLFARGADYVAAMVFMFASTNLVVELGIVLIVLIGWQFVAAELVGGVIMIVLLVTFGGLWLRGKALADARRHVEDAEAAAAHLHGAGAHDGHAATPTQQGWRTRIRTRAGWADAAAYTMSDLSMLRKEMAFGYLAAGFLAALVPSWLWGDVFIHGHGTWTTLENVAVGPLVALSSFVCSVGNVPLAAALWAGGISFGGVVAFIFADLISLPIVLVYRKHYGHKMALRMLAVFWVTMSAAGLATEYLFRAVSWIPARRPAGDIGGKLAWNATTALDIAALVVFAALLWLYSNRARLGAGVGYAKDPVCGMQVEIAHAPATAVRDSVTHYFCSERCRDRFVGAGAPEEARADEHVDPICGMKVDPRTAPASRHLGDEQHWFCCTGCAETFDRMHAEVGPAAGDA